MALLPALLAHADRVFFAWIILLSAIGPLGLCLGVGFVLAISVKGEKARESARRALVWGSTATVATGVLVAVVAMNTGATVFGPARDVLTLLGGLIVPGPLVGLVTGLVTYRRGQSARS